jgi:hypothetical protein
MNIKKTLQLSEVARHPMLQPDRIDGVLTYFPQRANEYPLARYMPLVNVNSDKVYMDIEKVARGGMTPAVALGSHSPIYGSYGQGQVEFEAAEFREKVILSEGDLYNLRQIGSKDAMMQARELLMRKFSQVEVRLLNRLEWMRRQLLFENQVRANYADGGELVVNYMHPEYLQINLGANDLWTATTTADPIATLQDIVEDFILNTGYEVDKVILPLGGFRLLTQLEAYKKISVNSHGAFRGDRESVRQLLLDVVGIGEIEEWTHQISFVAEIAADANAGAGTVTLNSTDELQPGDTMILRSVEDRSSELVEVAAVNGKTVTLAGPIARAGGFRRGDVVRYSKFVIPRDKLLILGNPTGMMSTEGSASVGPDGAMLQNWADVCSTLSRYENLETPRAGIFSKTIDKTNDDPPHIEEVLGIRALPRVHYSEAWAWAKFR